MYIGVLSSYIFVYHLYVWYPRRPEDSTGYLEARVIGSSGCWEWNPGHGGAVSGRAASIFDHLASAFDSNF